MEGDRKMEETLSVNETLYPSKEQVDKMSADQILILSKQFNSPKTNYVLIINELDYPQYQVRTLMKVGWDAVIDFDFSQRTFNQCVDFGKTCFSGRTVVRKTLNEYNNQIAPWFDHGITFWIHPFTTKLVKKEDLNSENVEKENEDTKKQGEDVVIGDDTPTLLFPQKQIFSSYWEWNQKASAGFRKVVDNLHKACTSHKGHNETLFVIVWDKRNGDTNFLRSTLEYIVSNGSFGPRAFILILYDPLQDIFYSLDPVEHKGYEKSISMFQSLSEIYQTGKGSMISLSYVKVFELFGNLPVSVIPIISRRREKEAVESLFRLASDLSKDTTTEDSNNVSPQPQLYSLPRSKVMESLKSILANLHKSLENDEEE